MKYFCCLEVEPVDSNAMPIRRNIVLDEYIILICVEFLRK